MVAIGVAQQSASAQPATSATATPSSGNHSPASSERVVIKVGDVQVTQAQFESILSDLEAQQGPADLSRQAIGDNYTELLMLSQQAVANHLDTSPAVLHQLAIDRTQILSNAQFAELKGAAKPTPEEVDAYYKAHLDDYETITLRRLFIWKRQPGVTTGRGLSPQDAETLASAIRQAYATGADPKKLIHDTNSVVLDDEPLTFQRGEMPEKMEQAAFGIGKDGDWVVFEDSDVQLVLLQLVKRTHFDLKAVTPQIRKKLQADKLRAELDAMKKKTGVWMDEQYFAPTAKSTAPNTQPQASGQKESADKREEKNADERQK